MSHLASILRRRAFRDGFHDGKRGNPMRRLTDRRERYHYALGRIFANLAPRHVRIFNQRQVSPEALHLALIAQRKGFLRA